MKKYRILESTNASCIEGKINSCLEKGYELSGELIVRVVQFSEYDSYNRRDTTPSIIYLQAIILDEDNLGER